jgi:hypothetical protein
MKRIRLVLAVVLFVVSISLLVWGYSPNPRATRERIIPPAELRLPTPSSLHFDLLPA